MATKHPMDALIQPDSVALVGVSRKTGKGTLNILEKLVQFGYKGEIYPVNPEATEILGVKTYRDTGSLPEGIDLAILATPRHVVPEILERCAEKRINAAIIVTEGFGEADEKGRLLQRSIDHTCAKKGIRVLGPNSVGVVNAFHDFSSSFIPLPKRLSPVALISQSGGFFEGFPGCPFGKGIDLGNTSDVDFVDTISYFEKDEQIRVIVLHVEGIQDVRGFLRTCRKASRSKPIVAVKGGTSRSGSLAAASHTGSLSGKTHLYSAMFRQSRVIQADSPSGIGDMVKAFLSLPPFTGDRVAVVTPTGAGGILVLDSVEKFGFQPAVISGDATASIAPLFSPWARVRNPFDILSAGMAHGYKRVYTQVLEACLKDSHVDVVFTVCGAYTLKTIKEITVRYPEKPVVAWVTGSDETLVEEKARSCGFSPWYLSPDRAVYALKMVRDYYRYRNHAF